MDGRLYVGNLAYSTTAEDLRELFAPAGQVTAVELISDRDSGRSKGFAFVTLSTPAAAQKAIAQFNGHQLAGRALKISAAQPREPQPSAPPDGAYRSKLGAFSVTDRSPNTDRQPKGKPGSARPARGGGSGGYQSSLGAFGKGGSPAPGRRRGGGNRGS